MSDNSNLILNEGERILKMNTVLLRSRLFPWFLAYSLLWHFILISWMVWGDQWVVDQTCLWGQLLFWWTVGWLPVGGITFVTGYIKSQK